MFTLCVYAIGIYILVYIGYLILMGLFGLYLHMGEKRTERAKEKERVLLRDRGFLAKIFYIFFNGEEDQAEILNKPMKELYLTRGMSEDKINQNNSSR